MKTTQSQEEIDLSDIFIALWRGKFFIVAIAALFAVCSIYYTLTQPDIYRASTTLVPSTTNQGGGGRLASQFGGLASLAGISLGAGGVDKTGIALEILRSRAFIEKFIEKYDILAPLMASIDWNKSDNKLIFDEELYDPKAKVWSNKIDAASALSSWNSYQAFIGLINVSHDQDTGIIRISLEHYSPNIAKQWLSLLVTEINWTMREVDKREAVESIEFLTKKLEQTELTDMKRIFYQLIEEQTKTMMLAEVSDEYVLKTIDPANSPDQKSKPKRALTVIFCTFFGGMFSGLIVLIRFFYKKSNHFEAQVH